MNVIDLVSDKKWILPTAVGLTSGAIGVVGGYIYGTRRALANAQELLDSVEELLVQIDSALEDEEVPDAVQGEVVLDERIISQDEAEWIIKNHEKTVVSHYNISQTIVNAEPEIEPDPELEALLDEVEAEESEPEIENVFELRVAHDDTWDQEAEMQTRSPFAPYVIHEDEYFSDDMGFRQMTLIYYAGDDIMVDDKDVPIYNHQNVVGELNFGHGASNSTTVYVRNEELRGEYEILLNEGLYQIEVLGQQAEDELMHGEIHRGLRKFRDD